MFACNKTKETSCFQKTLIIVVKNDGCVGVSEAVEEPLDV